MELVKYLGDKIGNLTNSVYSIVSVGETGAKKVALSFDTITECSISSSSEIMEYPIESGINITDYKFNNPDLITLKGVIAQHSLVGELVNSLLKKQDVISQTYVMLDYLKSGIYNLEIQTKRRLYKKFTLQNYRVNETIDNFSLFEVEMDFKQIMEVKNAKQNYKSVNDTSTYKNGRSRTISL